MSLKFIHELASDQMKPRPTKSATIDLSDLARTTDEIFSLDELRTKIEENRPLRIKYGVDVTAPFLHIGHAVNLWMMRHFQEHGHKVVFLIGDFTTRIGDPTGKSKTRIQIHRDEIDRNAEEFIKQVGLILLTTPDVFEVRRNSEWFDKMQVDEFMSLLSLVTHSRLIERDMFQRRIEQRHEIYMHEMLYPILQGYDSFMLESDLTIVGSDQLFNELMGRFYQDRFGQRPQVVMTTKITPGIDGKEKQSKSLGNYIAITDTPRDKFGKVMSISDSLIVPYFRVYTNLPLLHIQEIEGGLVSGSIHPMQAKKELAAAIVVRYHGKEVASEEEHWFTKAFSERKIPNNIPEIIISHQRLPLEVLQMCLVSESKSALRRLIGAGGLRINNERVDEMKAPLDLKDGDVVKVGKTKWFRIRIN
jgi:tyrosyl-tRNA synthetase